VQEFGYWQDFNYELHANEFDELLTVITDEYDIFYKL
jgi:hypothetical protein